MLEESSAQQPPLSLQEKIQQGAATEKAMFLTFISKRPSADKLKKTNLNTLDLWQNLQFNVMHKLGIRDYDGVQAFTSDQPDSLSSRFKIEVKHQQKRFESKLDEEGVNGWEEIVNEIAKILQPSSASLH